MKPRTNTLALKQKMLQQGINTKKELADKSGIDRTIIGKILNGKTQPSADAMYKLVDALSIPPEEAGLIFFS